MSMHEYASKCGVFYSPRMVVNGISCLHTAGVVGSIPTSPTKTTLSGAALWAQRGLRRSSARPWIAAPWAPSPDRPRPSVEA